MDLVDIARFLLSFVVVIGLIGGFAWVLRRYGAGRITAGGKGRLAVVEIAPVDAKRRLVLIRRDGVEHLVLLSATSETVIETGIASPAGAPAGSAGFAANLQNAAGPAADQSGTPA